MIADLLFPDELDILNSLIKWLFIIHRVHDQNGVHVWQVVNWLKKNQSEVWIISASLTQVRSFFFSWNKHYFLILQTCPSKTLYFGGICFVHHATFFGWICRKVKKIELSDISRATRSQIGQSRFVHFILRCHSVIVISHLSQIYCCFYSDLRT